jgi:hypothetical protein
MHRINLDRRREVEVDRSSSRSFLVSRQLSSSVVASLFTPFARRPREMRRAISRLARLEADARAARALSSSAASASTSGRDRVGTSRAAAVITDLRARRETSWWDRNAARNERREKERLERRDRALAAGDLAAIVDPPRRVALGREKNVLLNRELLNARGAEEILALCVDRRDDFGTFYTLVPIRPRWRGERRSLRTLPGVSLRPPHAFNPRPRRLSTPTDALSPPRQCFRLRRGRDRDRRARDAPARAAVRRRQRARPRDENKDKNASDEAVTKRPRGVGVLARDQGARVGPAVQGASRARAIEAPRISRERARERPSRALVAARPRGRRGRRARALAAGQRARKGEGAVGGRGELRPRARDRRRFRARRRGSPQARPPFTLVPVRPRSRRELHSLRTNKDFLSRRASLSAHHPSLSLPPTLDAFQLHP